MIPQSAKVLSSIILFVTDCLRKLFSVNLLSSCRSIQLFYFDPTIQYKLNRMPFFKNVSDLEWTLIILVQNDDDSLAEGSVIN